MADIRYQFVASGHESVERAFLGIERAAQRSSRGVEQAYAGQVRAARRTAAEQERATRRPVNRLDQLAKQVERDQIRAAQREQRRQEQAARAEVRAKERAAAQQLRIADKQAATERRNQERAAREQTKLEQRIARDREKSLAYVARLRDRHFLQEQRQQERRVRQAQVEGAAMGRRGFRQEQWLRDRMARNRTPLFSNLGGELKGMAIGGAVAGGALAMGTGGAALRDAMSLQSMANRIAINARKHGQDFIDPVALRKEFEAAAIASRGAVKAEEIAAGTGVFAARTGDMAKARRFMGTFTTAAAATGTSYEDIASAAAELSTKFAIDTAEQMQEALASITFGGKEGSFELADAARKYAKLASAGATFGLDKGVGGVRVLQGLSQIAMSSTGDRDVATTAVEAMFRQIVTESKAIERLGVDVFTDDSRTKTRAITDILPEIMAATGGDKVLLQDIFKDEGKRAINPLIDTFSRAYQGATGPGGKRATEKDRVAAGKAAVSAQLSENINAPGTWADMMMDAEQATQSSTAKLGQMWERFVSSMADKALPALERMIDKMEVSQGAIDAFATAFEGFLDLIRFIGEDLGILKNPMENKGFRQDQERRRIREIDRQLQAMPSEEKARSLEAAGDIAGAQTMRAQLANPETTKRMLRLSADKMVSQDRLAKLDRAEEGLAKARAMGGAAKSAEEFADLWVRLGGTDTAETRMRAQIVAKGLAANPMGAKSATEEFLQGENADQRAARLGFAKSVAEQKVQAGGRADERGAELAGKGLSAAVMELVNNVNTASGAIKKLAESQQATIWPT